MAHRQLEPAPASLERSIQLCLDCYDLCTQTEAHCVRLGGRFVEPRHLQTLADCARIAQVTADFMLRGSPAHKALCRTAAHLCMLCADECAREPGDEQLRRCAEACVECAEACRRTAGA